MGHAASKEIKETELGEGTLHEDESKSISPELISKVALTTAKSKGSGWMDAESKKMLWSVKSKGKMMKKYSVVTLVDDKDTDPIATIITIKSGMNHITNVICKADPSYEDQEPLTEEEMKKVGVTDASVKLYPFSKITTKRGMSTASTTYHLATGKDEEKMLYEGNKLSAMGFMAIFKDSKGTVVAKAATHGMSFSPTLEAAIGVDLLAIVCMGCTLASNDGTAGALAGAGVV